MAATNGPSTQFAPACMIAAVRTTPNDGYATRTSALKPIVATAHGSQQPLGSHRIDQGAARNLSQQGHERADAQHQPDLGLRPGLGRQVDGDERNEARLNVGQEEHEPVEAALALPRGWLQAGAGACTSSCCPAGEPAAVAAHACCSARPVTRDRYSITSSARASSSAEPQAKGLGGLQIDHEIELLEPDREIGWLCRPGEFDPRNAAAPRYIARLDPGRRTASAPSIAWNRGTGRPSGSGC